MKPKIVDNHYICLFCGNEMPERYEEYTLYRECDCPDAVNDREIVKEIGKLMATRPKHRYSITTKLVLYKNNDDE